MYSVSTKNDIGSDESIKAVATMIGLVDRGSMPTSALNDYRRIGILSGIVDCFYLSDPCIRWSNQIDPNNKNLTIQQITPHTIPYCKLMKWLGLITEYAPTTYDSGYQIFSLHLSNEGERFLHAMYQRQRSSQQINVTLMVANDNGRILNDSPTGNISNSPLSKSELQI